MSQYNLVPPKQKQQSAVSSRIIIILSLVLILISVVIIVGISGEKPDTALAPTPTVTPTVSVLRYAWIETRDTCPESPEYKQQVVPGAGLWESPGMKTKPGIVPHGTVVGILEENAEWIQVDYAGQSGYVQSFFVVDYDPLKEFRPATGGRYCLLCTLTCTDENVNNTPTATSLPDSQERTIIYEINVIDEGQGNMWMMKFTYTDEFGNIQQAQGTTPWRHEFNAHKGQSLSVSTRNGLNSNRFECKIIVNGEIVVQRENWGQRKEVLCSDVVR